jgi:hypothetical protein
MAVSTPGGRFGAEAGLDPWTDSLALRDPAVAAKPCATIVVPSEGRPLPAFIWMAARIHHIA